MLLLFCDVKIVSSSAVLGSLSYITRITSGTSVLWHHGENADFGYKEDGGTEVLNPEPWQEWVSHEGLNWFQHDVTKEWFYEAKPGLWKCSVLWQHSENPSRYFIVKEEKKEEKEEKRRKRSRSV